MDRYRREKAKEVKMGLSLNRPIPLSRSLAVARQWSAKVCTMFFYMPAPL